MRTTRLAVGALFALITIPVLAQTGAESLDWMTFWASVQLAVVALLFGAARVWLANWPDFAVRLFPVLAAFALDWLAQLDSPGPLVTFLAGVAAMVIGRLLAEPGFRAAQGIADGSGMPTITSERRRRH